MISKLACDNGLQQAAEARRFRKEKLEELATLYVTIADKVESLAEEASWASSDDGITPAILNDLFFHVEELREALK